MARSSNSLLTTPVAGAARAGRFVQRLGGSFSGAMRGRITGLRWLWRSPGGALGAALMLILVLSAVAAPLLAPYDPLSIDVRNRLVSPGPAHLLGTDHLGRDVLSRLLFGARASLGAAAAVVALITVMGMAVGLVSGFLGGWVDQVLMGLVDILLAFPSFILALVVAGLLGPGLRNVVLGLAMVRWVGCARVVRSLVLSLREREYVEAARCIGAGGWHILWRHITPNVLGTVLILTSLDLGTTILSLSGLGYIGLGVQLPDPEWGAMLNYSRPYIQTAPLLMVFPGMAITLSVLSANLLGDALRDLLDPHYRGRM